MGSSHFSCKTSTKDDRCFVVNSRKGRRQRVLLTPEVHGCTSGICIVWTCNRQTSHANKPTFARMPFLPSRSVPFNPSQKSRVTMEKAPLKDHCLLYEGQRVSCLLSSNFLMCRLSFVVSPPPTIRLVIAISLGKCSLRADEINL